MFHHQREHNKCFGCSAVQCVKHYKKLFIVMYIMYCENVSNYHDVIFFHIGHTYTYQKQTCLVITIPI